MAARPGVLYSLAKSYHRRLIYSCRPSVRCGVSSSTDLFVLHSSFVHRLIVVFCPSYALNGPAVTTVDAVPNTLLVSSLLRILSLSLSFFIWFITQLAAIDVARHDHSYGRPPTCAHLSLVVPISFIFRLFYLFVLLPSHQLFLPPATRDSVQFAAARAGGFVFPAHYFSNLAFCSWLSSRLKDSISVCSHFQPDAQT